jgi:hypothetical protein
MSDNGDTRSTPPGEPLRGRKGDTMQLGERTESSTIAPLDVHADGSASVLTLAPRTIPLPDAATIAASRARHPSMAPADPPTATDEPNDPGKLVPSPTALSVLLLGTALSRRRR